MAFKFALLAAVCLAQGFAFQPLAVFRGKAVCKNPASEIPYEFEGAVHEIDEVRESVSTAAMDAYAKGNNFEVVVACFKEQRKDFFELGERVSGMIKDASLEMYEKLGEKADKYAKLMEGPLKVIAVTLKGLPERVYELINNKEFLKAYQLMKEARRVVEENSRILGNIMQEMVAEVPELADRAEQMAQEIRNEARKGCEAINQAFRKCVEEGGPKNLAFHSEE